MTEDPADESDDGAGTTPTAAELRTRVAQQFGDGDRADVWRGFERFLPTRQYLNIGYSPRGVPHVLGSSQRRLAAVLAGGLTDRLQASGTRLLDLGCGRGGPAREFASKGFDVTGVDLVPYNLALARETVGRRADDGVAAEFVAGEATRLPLATDGFGACAAVDSLTYVPEKRRALSELSRVLEPGGVLAVADLLAAEDPSGIERSRLDAFADAWDLAPVVAGGTYRSQLREAGFVVETVEDVTANSTGRFRKWSSLFLALADGPAGAPLDRLLRRWGADPEAVLRRVRRAHEALPHLRHVVVYARVPAQ